MTHETRMQLTRQLEDIKHANEGANARWLFFFWTAVETLFGVVFLGGAITVIASAGADHNKVVFYFGCALILCAMSLFGHVARIMTNRFMNRKLRLLYEAVLQVQDGQ